MNIPLSPELESALNDQAHRQGVKPEELAARALNERFLHSLPPVQPQDEWERRLLGLAKDCGVSLSDESLSRQALYD
jgi:hypothetical protein